MAFMGLVQSSSRPIEEEVPVAQSKKSKKRPKRCVCLRLAACVLPLTDQTHWWGEHKTVEKLSKNCRKRIQLPSTYVEVYINIQICLGMFDSARDGDMVIW